MQGAKDSFYIALRDRIASINPQRTAVVRGMMRTGVVVAENELPTTVFAPDAFSLRWTAVSADVSDGLVQMECEIGYATDGSAGSNGMDRGRALAAMDLELVMALRREPQHTAEAEYASGGATTLPTTVFWTDPVLGKIVVGGERLSRTATVAVFAYQGSGTL